MCLQSFVLYVYQVKDIKIILQEHLTEGKVVLPTPAQISELQV
jgi:hypothetical protein